LLTNPIIQDDGRIWTVLFDIIKNRVAILYCEIGPFKPHAVTFAGFATGRASWPSSQ
jgi:hypothetical protein